MQPVYLSCVRDSIIFDARLPCAHTSRIEVKFPGLSPKIREGWQVCDCLKRKVHVHVVVFTCLCLCTHTRTCTCISFCN